MPDVRGVAIAMDIGQPLELSRVGVPSANMARLELLELLLSA